MAKRFYYHGKKNDAPKADDAPRYPSEQLSVTLENMNVTPKTAELLAKSGVNTAGDLTKRTEKDMFKIQGFNKKMLFELKDALKAQGMTFKPEAPKPETAAQSKPQNAAPRDNSRPERGDRGDRRDKSDRDGSPKTDRNDQRDGRSDRNDRNGRNQDRRDRQPDKDKKPLPPKPEKLTEPLQVPDWRKIQKGGKWGFFDGFKTVIPAMYDEVFCFKDGLASVELDEKCGYIDSENNIVIDFVYDTAMSFSEGLAVVFKGEKCGYINKENEVVIPFVYDAATAFEGGEAKVKQTGRWGTITPDGTVKWI